MSQSGFVTYSVNNRIAEIVMCRPPANAFSLALLDEILAALRQAAEDDQVRAVLLRSALPKIFCAGLDLDLLLGKSGLEIRSFLEKLYVELWDVQYGMGKPTIAVVNGAARGGGMTLSISCDVILAGDKATFGYPEIDLAVLPAVHFAPLPRLVGRYRAFELPSLRMPRRGCAPLWKNAPLAGPRAFSGITDSRSSFRAERSG